VIVACRRSYARVSRPESVLFLPSSSSIVITRLSGPHSRPTSSQKIWQRRESNPGLLICSQDIWKSQPVPRSWFCSGTILFSRHNFLRSVYVLSFCVISYEHICDSPLTAYSVFDRSSVPMYSLNLFLSFLFLGPISRLNLNWLWIRMQILLFHF
jgi:hypothetical protein